MDYFKQFVAHIQNNDYPAFLNLWEEYCMGDEIDPEELKRILEAAKRSTFVESFGKYVEQILELWKTIEDPNQSHTIIKLIFDIQTSDSPQLIDLAFDYLEKNYETDPRFVENMRLIGLRDKKQCRNVISKYELLKHMLPGNFVFHTSGWGVGEIMEVSFLREQLSLEFDYVSGLKDFTFENAFNTLIPIPSDHFLALRFGRPDYLEKQAKEQPVEVIHMLLRDLGPKTAFDIKEEMCDLIIPAQDWVKWWQTARVKLKKDTKIAVPAESKGAFSLREEELPHEERLSKALEEKPGPNNLIQLVFAHLRDFPQTLKNETFKQTLKQKLTDSLNFPEVDTGQKLQILYFLQDLTDQKEFSPIKDIITQESNIKALIDSIEVTAFKKRTLQMIKAYRPDWQQIFIDLFLNLDPAPLRELIMEELLAAEKRSDVEKTLEKLLANPERYPQTLLWYFQKITGKNTLPYNNPEGRSRFFEAFFILMSHLEKAGEKDMVKKMINQMTKARFALVRKIMQDATKQAVQEILLLASKCHSIEDHDLKTLHSLAEVVHPSLKSLRKTDKTEEVDDTIWTTQAGLDKIKQRIEEIGSVEMIENAREIEEARSHGDLRENAEFKAACERRDRLQSELKLLSDQIHKSRVLTIADVDVKAAGIGTVIECQAKDETLTFTLLGPWDAMPEQNILSFQSKLAKAMIGKKVGESFEHQDKSYTILTIRNYFD